jgi:hypothetical protein
VYSSPARILVVFLGGGFGAAGNLLREQGTVSAVSLSELGL